MQKLRIESFTISIDGYAAGPKQNLDNPMGIAGINLHNWAFPTKTFQHMMGKDGGTTGVDNDFASRGFNDIGAWIMGRNMFGPVRGPWPENKVDLINVDDLKAYRDFMSEKFAGMKE